MTRIDECGRIAAALLSLFGSARAFDPSDLDASARIWAGPEGSRANGDSPFAPVASLGGLGGRRGRGEAELRLRRGGLTADLSARTTARRGETLATQGMVNELFYEADGEAGAESILRGQHFTVGKKVVSWDVGFGYRPLDVVQQEDRRALRPFALEGVPLLAWELFGEDAALTLLYANPLRGRAPAPRDDESVALRAFRRLGPVDLHLAARYSGRTRLQAGAAAALVLAESIELHASSRYQRRSEHFAVPSAGASAPISVSDASDVAVSWDVPAALVGFTLTPGRGFSILGEGWIDPGGGTAEEWRDLGELAARQRAALGDAALPAAAVLAGLARELSAFDRPNLLRESVFLRVSWKGERLEPAVDVLVTPADRGWVATAAVSYQGEHTRLDAGLRLLGGPPGSAHRLLPESAIFYASLQVFL